MALPIDLVSDLGHSRFKMRSATKSMISGTVPHHSSGLMLVTIYVVVASFTQKFLGLEHYVSKCFES